MALRRKGDKPLSEPLRVNLLTHICVTRTQWVKFQTHIFVVDVGKTVGETTHGIPLLTNKIDSGDYFSAIGQQTIT